VIQKLASVVAPGGDLAGAEDTSPDPCALNDANTGPVCAATKNNAQSREQRSGTSMSAPIMAGLITRLAHRFPNRSGVQIAELLVSTGAQFAYTVGAPNIPRVRPLKAFQIASTPRELTSLSVSTNCSSSLISWQIPEIMQATGYRYRTAVDFDALAFAAITQVPNTNSQIINVPTGHTLVQVLAFDVQGNGSWSDPVIIQRAPCAPATIRNFVADRIGSGSGYFCWGSTANTTSYQVEDRPIGSAFTGQPTVNAISGLNYAGSLDPFSFPDVRAKVRACNNSGCGDWSAEAELLDRNIMSLPPPDYISPCSTL